MKSEQSGPVLSRVFKSFRFAMHLKRNVRGSAFPEDPGLGPVHLDWYQVQRAAPRGKLETRGILPRLTSTAVNGCSRRLQRKKAQSHYRAQLSISAFSCSTCIRSCISKFQDLLKWNTPQTKLKMLTRLSHLIASCPADSMSSDWGAQKGLLVFKTIPSH